MNFAEILVGSIIAILIIGLGWVIYKEYKDDDGHWDINLGI
jgi:hypothetical protein